MKNYHVDSAPLKSAVETSITVFDSERFGSIRAVTIDDEPWFVAADICNAFGETNRNRAMQALDEEEKGYTQMSTPGGIQRMAIVNEAGVYSLLFAMQPQKARGVSDEYVEQRQSQLKQFKRWVTSEVLPSIRKTGGYVANDELFIDTYIPFADESTKALFRLQLQTTRELNSKVKEQKALLAEAEPKVEYYDRLIDQGDTLSIRDTAKSVGLTERTLIYFLQEKNMLYRDNKHRLRPYAAHCPKHFVLKEFINEKNGYASVQTRVTVEGREKIMKLLKKDSEVKAQ